MTQHQTLTREIEAYATTLEDIAERWNHALDAHTRQVARRLRVILGKHPATDETPVTYTGTLNYHGLDLMLDVHEDGTHEIRCRPVLRNEWTTWSAPVTLVADPAAVTE